MASNITIVPAAKAARIGKAISPRSISIRVTPPPITFAERRSVLQALEQHGKVEFFKLNENHDSLFISLMKDEDAANQLVAASPLRYSVALPQTSPETLLSDLKGRNSLAKSEPVTTLENPNSSVPSVSSPSGVDCDSGSSAGWPQKEFEIHVWPNPSYEHNKSSRSALHRSWPSFIGGNDSFLTKTLQQSLPKNLATKGLSNWSPDLGMRQIKRSLPAIEERNQMRSWLPGKLWKQAQLAQQQNKAKEMSDGEVQSTNEPGATNSLSAALFGPSMPKLNQQKSTTTGPQAND